MSLLACSAPMPSELPVPQASARRLLAALAALPLAGLLCACTWNDGSGCTGAPVPGVASLWLDCEEAPLDGPPLSLALTNDSGETLWTYHHCEEAVPWPARREADGTWTALLPPAFSLPLACEHVEVLEPGESLELSLPVTSLAGTYRAETVVGWACGDLHDPRFLPGTCERTELVVSAPVELR